MNEIVSKLKYGVLMVFMVLSVALLFSGCMSQRTAGDDSTMHTKVSPQNIADDLTCGKCGMYPARYPKWQSQIVFADGSMTPFDGCKCMFGFLFDMGRYDKNHSPDDVAAVLVKDFNSGNWMNAEAAIFIVGSSEMGPMGKELIPFAEHTAAMNFQTARGGEMMMYEEISRATLKPLMGGMKNMKKMKM